MRFILALFIFGGVLCFIGYQEVQLGKVAKPEPQSLSCEELGKYGPGDNAHVVLTDLIVSDSYVYEGDSDQKFDKIWVPLVSTNSEYFHALQAIAETGEGSVPPLTEIQVVLKSSHVRNQADFDRLYEQTELKGLVINKIETLSGEELSILKNSYPGVDFNKVYLVEHNRKPKGMGAVMGFFSGGGLLMAASAFFGIRRKRTA